MELSWKLILYQVVNFFVLMAILTFLFNKFLHPFLRRRTEGIRQSFADIETQKKEVEGLKKEFENRINEMKEQVRAEIEKAVKEGNRMRGEIMAQGEKDSAALVDKARLEIEAERQKAITMVQREVASLSILATEHLIKKQVDEQTNRRLVEDFIAELSEHGQKKGGA